MKVICFDLDDTLVDFNPGEKKARLVLIHRLATKSQTSVDHIGRIYDDIWYQIKPGYMEMVNNGLNEMAIRNIHLSRLIDVIHCEEASSHLTQIHWDLSLGNLKVYPDADSVIKYLSEKYNLAMITNGPSDLQREKINRLKFLDLFDEIIISGDLGYHKPDEKIFKEMTKRTGADPSDIVYIGNNYQKDVVGAHQAGWKTVWVNRKNEEERKITPTWTVKELAELVKIF